MDAIRVMRVIGRIADLIGFPAGKLRIGPKLDVGQRGQSVVANDRIALLETVERGNVDAAGRAVEAWERVSFHIHIFSDMSHGDVTIQEWIPYAETTCLRSAIFSFFRTLVADAVGVAMTQLGDSEDFTLAMESPR